jgi:hypothetical protein
VNHRETKLALNERLTILLKEYDDLRKEAEQSLSLMPEIGKSIGLVIASALIGANKLTCQGHSFVRPPVQISSIERNGFGAVKAVNAARMAMNETGDHKVSLDHVIRTMYATGRDMQAQYKETSLAGLAVNVAKC